MDFSQLLSGHVSKSAPIVDPSCGEAVIQSWQCFAHAVYPRNSVVFGGNRFRVSHLGPAASAASVNTLLIPYSIYTIFDSYHSRQLESLVFEFWSELRSIGCCAFSESSLKFIFIPRSVHSISARAHSCPVESVYFYRHYCLLRLKGHTFEKLSNLSMVTIRSSVRQIRASAFVFFPRLHPVTFELP
jgi:hypothetical protein